VEGRKKGRKVWKSLGVVGEGGGRSRKRHGGVSSAEWYALYDDAAARVDAEGEPSSSCAGKVKLVDEKALRRLEGLSPTREVRREDWEVQEDGEL